MTLLDVARRRNARKLPALVVAADPDSYRTALAWAVRGDATAGAGGGTEARYRLVGVEGGGAGKHVVPWQTITGARRWLEACSSTVGCELVDVTAVVELQAPNGQHSADVEALRRVRYHWDAACELLGAKYVEADPRVWEVEVAGKRCGGRGAQKRAAQARARQLAPGWIDNGDQADAVGILLWYLRSLNATLVTTT